MSNDTIKSNNTDQAILSNSNTTNQTEELTYLLGDLKMEILIYWNMISSLKKFMDENRVRLKEMGARNKQEVI